MSYAPIAGTELAAVVTYLDMRAPPGMTIPSSPLRLDRRERVAPDAYRTLFRTVGAPWLWFSRLVASDAELTALLYDPAVALSAVIDEAGEDVGMLELDYRKPGECELSFVGLIPGLSGQGHGRWLLAEAVTRAWAHTDVTRVHVHTCTLDHPAALAAYRRAGFTPYARAIERFADPRAAGILPPDAAPQVALLGTPDSGPASPDRWA
jgi:GNAT superfamily N-acetyltransferase